MTKHIGKPHAPEDEPYVDWDYEDDPDDDEDDLDLFDDCGMTSEGLCMYAGSEWCDFSCPLQRLHDRARAALSQDK